ncbi:dihydrolipoamide dehydrogenase [Halohasta litchfieldiae]|jgi:dihydrolipoamide dehydrogenase|uniref:Dihydrolipoamide dehydrogenase n=1 Tax=Halohasta litchfieldiae TaxID=1073996 RepID=A0A1H6TIV5_9EURY|nr:NAD(P)/FAD-dependent oxidoreductase [Halohasta litchfieldiae]ATW88834.1 dihydrolipoamide dehydrogenase [Halohasta litchfieldiae]SEI79236.1 dihydrolipoamide dehydrogenase [Halohasta litchfieldiae]
MHVMIIGAYGSAGSAVAEGLVDHVGDTVDRLTLVDDGEPGGGLCILNGCMPSKEVLSAAAHRYEMRADDRLDGEPATINLQRTVERKNEHVDSFAAHRRGAIHEMSEREGVEFIHDTARFVDDRVVEIDSERYEPDYVVIATGSSPNIPDLPGIDEVDYYTSKDVLDATELPDSGIVMGFGYIGVELVPYLAEAGVDCTVIEHDARPIDEADSEFGDELLDLYRDEFDIEILTNTWEKKLESTDGGVRLHIEQSNTESTVDAEELFLFTGRTPTLDSVGIANTSLRPRQGWVDETMRAVDDEQVFVVGDVNQKEPILHVAKEQGYIAADNILADHADEQLQPYSNIHHHVIFSGASVYPFARVGHTPASAEEAGYDVVTATRWAADDGVFKVKAVPHGLARLTVDADTGTVLGYQGLHAHADTMAKTLQVIVEMGLDVREIPDRAYHPTLPEVLDGLFRETATEVGA